MHLVSCREVNGAAVLQPVATFLHQAEAAVHVRGQECADWNIGHCQSVSQGLQPPGSRPHVHVHQPAFAAQHAPDAGLAAVAAQSWWYLGLQAL